jgi:hypothetical protein
MKTPIEMKNFERRMGRPFLGPISIVYSSFVIRGLYSDAPAAKELGGGLIASARAAAMEPPSPLNCRCARQPGAPRPRKTPHQLAA